MYDTAMNDLGAANETPGSAMTVEPERLALSLLHAARALEGEVERVLGGVGLSAPKLTVLSILVDVDEPLALSDLASRLSCVRSNVTQLVDRLEADGLVRRVHDANDRRSVRAELSALGRERQAVGARLLAGVQAEFVARLSAGDRAALDRMLAALSEIGAGCR